MHTISIGSIGEQHATEALVRDGYMIIGRNWKTKSCEIDIIARKDDIIYFVEVKTRTGLGQGDGFAYITHDKLRRMQRAAAMWVASQRWQGEIVLMAASVDGITGATDFAEIA